MPDPNYLSEIEREDGTVLTIRDAEAHAEIAEQLEQIENNKTNILAVADQTTQYNLLPITKIETSQAGNLTIVESGGIITINGTQSGGIAAVGIPFNIKAGQYYVQGCPSGGSDNTYRVDIRTATGGTLYSNDYDYGTGFLLTVSTDTSLVYNIRLNDNNTYTNIKVKPMIIPKELYDLGFTDFQPYALSNAELTTKEQTNENNILTLERLNGAKNLAPYNSGEHIGNASYWFLHTNCIDIAAGTSVYLVYDYTQTAGQYSLQLTDENGQIISGTASYTTDGATSGHRVTKVTIPTGKTAKGYNAYHNTNATVTISNFMIVPAEIYEAGFTDYQPYALPNTKITPELIDLVDSGAKNIFNEPVLTTGSAGEINVTVNGDGTFTLNTSGATTANSGVRIGWFTGKQGVTYAVSNYSPLCQLRVRYGSDIILDTSGGTNTFVAPSNAKAELIWYVPSGTTLTNYVLKPMVCSKAAWDVSQKFVPYAMNNTELTNSKETCVRSNITDNVANNAASGTLYGSLSLTGITDAWGALTTYIFNNNGTRRMQICMTPNSSKKRFYDDNGWGAWSDI